MIDHIVARLERVPGLVAAYLFGSRARGTARPSSDVDIGIWLTRAPRSFDEYPFNAAADLEQALSLRVDLVVLNGAPSDLVHRVLADGALLVERDRAARVRLEVASRADYFDMLPIRNAYRRPPQARP